MRWLLAAGLLAACAAGRGTEAEEDDEGGAGLAFTAGGAAQPVPVARARRYLLYDVNPGEGFNLRRDVYMRVATLLQKLGKAEPWVLVLPPWGRMYHWQSRSLSQQQQQRIPWSAFFNTPSLAAYVPVIEYEEYLKENGGPFIEQVFYLQSYAEGWTEGKWEEKVDVRPCVEKPVYRLDEHGYYRGWFWGYPETRAKNVTCLSVQGMASIMVPLLLRNTSARSVMLDRAENLLHDEYGQKTYWDARRSMVFARPLRAWADEFRAEHLNSTDATDNTFFQEDWRKMRVKVGTATGGPYLAAHLRRKDFLYGHSGDVPSLEAAANTLHRLMKQLKLPRVFIATDADQDEVRELRMLLPQMVHLEPTQAELHRFLDGGIAIIDQWICAHARYFIGTSVSTFSFRIHEEREILGFDPRSTYNRFCGDAEDNCEQPTRWKVIY